jgi:hypothetical protein
MDSPDDVWQAVHRLSQIFDAQFPTTARLRAYATKCCEAPELTRLQREREVQYVLCSMEELLGLIREMCPAADADE